MSVEIVGLKVKVLFFGLVRQIFQTGEAEITLEDDPSIRALLDRVCDSPERHRKIFDESGALSSDLTILRNGTNISFLDGLETSLEEGDQVALLGRLAGG